MTPPTEDEVRMALMVLGNALGSEAQHLSIASAIATIETALDEARKDKARLDWLEASGCYVTTSDVDFTPVPLPNLRAAIDQARGA